MLDSGPQDTTDPGRPRRSESQHTLHSCPFTHTYTHTHTPCYFMVLTGGTVCPTLSSQRSICAHPQPSVSHLPQEGYPLKRNPVVEAPCPGPSDAAGGGGGCKGP